VTLRNLVSSGRRGTITGLARILHVTPQAASEMVHRLVAEGLVEQGDGRELTLTGRGRTIADTIFRRHALVEWLLIEVIGLGWAESDEEAQRLQGAISERVGASLDDFLGHPETCPHGNPIDVAAAKRRPAGVPLNSVPSGARATIYRITEEAEEDTALLSYLEARGLRPGAAIAMRSCSEALDTISLEGPRGAATLGFRPAALVLVLPGDADPALFHHVPMSAARFDPR
jgi:DtxR family Mn-dependent transcriptional regulator